MHSMSLPQASQEHPGRRIPTLGPSGFPGLERDLPFQVEMIAAYAEVLGIVKSALVVPI